MAMIVIVPRRVIVAPRSCRVGMLGGAPVVLLAPRGFMPVSRRTFGRVLVRMVMPVMIVLFHSAHLTSLAQGSA
jgi:hypothetical protein